ncbi:hypothetical protein [Chryseobacterium chendengshani]|nr:hypothetical protein [Chryseobacterium sp. LJ756]
MTKGELKPESSRKMQGNTISFSEVRRANRSVNLGEYSIIKDFSETVKLYSQLDEKKFSRSEPVPTLSDDEYFLVLKPKLKKEKYGDVEVMKMELKNNILNIYYKEVTNSEYISNKQKNPILILRVSGKVPLSAKLVLNKNN